MGEDVRTGDVLTDSLAILRGQQVKDPTASSPDNAAASGRAAVALALVAPAFPSVEQRQQLDFVWGQLAELNARSPMEALYEILSHLGAPAMGLSKLEQVAQWMKLRRLAAQTHAHLSSLDEEMANLANRHSR